MSFITASKAFSESTLYNTEAILEQIQEKIKQKILQRTTKLVFIIDLPMISLEGADYIENFLHVHGYTVNYQISNSKKYEFTIEWGEPHC